MIIVTGAAGFIASRVVAALNEAGYRDLVLVDDFSRADKRANWQGLVHSVQLTREQLPQWLDDQWRLVQAVVHLGARTDTTERDEALFNRLNLHYSQAVWQACARHQIPLIYASSAATYGDGSLGFTDDDALLPQLNPLNAYARSKHSFDLWVQQQTERPFFWAGLKFFNVYGPNEYHKGRMASVVWHAYNQIKETGQVKLFQSHRPGVAHGAQARDFIYVADVARVIRWLLEERPTSGLYNLGSGQARTFQALAESVFAALGQTPQIEYIPMPEDLRASYQYFTEAPMTKLLGLGYPHAFTPLEAGAAEYVGQYLEAARQG